MSRPLVSICVPTCNRAGLLRQSLDTIVAQRYAPLEILISDNGSTDETEAVGRALAARDPRVRYVRHPKNIGLYENHNFCIEESRGEFFCFFHDDDEYGPDVIAEYVALMERAPRVGLVCSDWRLIDEESRPLGERRFTVDEVTPGLDYVDRTIRTGRSSLNCPGVLVRRAALGPRRFDVSGTLGATDFLLWFGVAEHADIGHVPRILWNNRTHRRSLSRGPVLRFAEHFHLTVSRYADDYLRRHPGEAARVARWREDLDGFTFWATFYEVCLHYRRRAGGRGGDARTTFEHADYRLDEAQLRDALARLSRYRRGARAWVAMRMLQALVRTRLTAPVGWAAGFAQSGRRLLGMSR